jgi:Flp pilus assembly protein TadB
LDIITPQYTLNETAYEIHGPLYSGAQFLWSLFFSYAAYTSSLVWVAFMGYPQIKNGFQKLWKRRNGIRMADQYNDQLNVIQRSYEEVPYWWFLILFLASLVCLVTIIAHGLFIPVWTYFVAIATGAVMVIPLAWIYALTNFELVS